MKKWKKYVLSLLVLGILLGFIGLHFIAPYGILKPTKHNIDRKPEDLNLKGTKIEIGIENKEKIKGYWIESQKDTTIGVMILVHGVGGCKEHFLGLAKLLAHEGIASVIFDNRAHGESGGSFCTYGFYEKQDVRKIVDYIKSEKPKLKIGIWGNSLGGAIAIQSLAIEERIDFGVIESTFTDFRKIVFDYKKRILKGIGIPFVANYAVYRAGIIADFDPDKVKPLEAVKEIEQAMFIAHGDADKNISVEYGKLLFENLKSENKELVIVNDGEHSGLIETGGIEYKNKLMNFILSQFAIQTQEN